MAYIIRKSEKNTVAALLQRGYKLMIPENDVGKEISIIRFDETTPGGIIVEEVVYTGTITSQLSSTLTQAMLSSGSEKYLLTFAIGERGIAGIMEVYHDPNQDTDCGGPGEDTDPGTWEAEEDGDPEDS